MMGSNFNGREMLEQQQRLEAKLQESALRGAMYKQNLQREQMLMANSEAMPFVRLAQQEERLSSHLEKCSLQQRLREVTASRRFADALDASFAQEARSGTALLQRNQERQKAAEERLLELQRKQAAAAEVAKQRWLESSMRSIEANRFIGSQGAAAATRSNFTSTPTALLSARSSASSSIATIASTENTSSSSEISGSEVFSTGQRDTWDDVLKSVIKH
eukprot:TRINITY_DN8444_c1_g1_i1.p1 TRINITY_DN8444_c1_g1~~TRINITY_DN8444_c1_g1_i1.p1  ORF type:complete len:219 (-),score=60.33 TRINITY_DN8444_c1_g1_i1:90-746(-)